jgi:hypothetical protein
LISGIDGLSPLENPISKGLTNINLGQQKNMHLGRNPSFLGKTKVKA